MTPESEAKFAVTVSGALIVTDVDALVVLATEPVQPAKVKPEDGVATIGTGAPRS